MGHDPYSQLRNIRRGPLFAEDFDAPDGIVDLDRVPEPPPEPEPAAELPDLDAIREAAYAEGHSAGLAAAMADRGEVTRHLLSRIADRLDDARSEAAAIADQTADAVARMIIDIVTRMLPATCARYGGDEVSALVRAVLPALTAEPCIGIRVNPQIAPALQSALMELEPDVQARVNIISAARFPAGDVHVTWRDGGATRDTQSIWREIVGSLTMLGLVNEATVEPASGLTLALAE